MFQTVEREIKRKFLAVEKEMKKYSQAEKFVLEASQLPNLNLLPEKRKKKTDQNRVRAENLD